MKHDAAVLLDAFLGGDGSGVTWMQNGVRLWLNGGGAFSLERALGLPGTQGKIAQELRNAYLILAAESLSSSSDPWQVASELSNAIRHFLVYRWPAWLQYDQPPKHASDLERLLFLGQKHKSLPKSKTQLYAILRDGMKIDPEHNAPRSADKIAPSFSK